MVIAVLDASAILAVLLEEPGATRVAEYMEDVAYVSAVNWSEVLRRLLRRQVSPALAERRLNEILLRYDLEVVPFDEPLARRAARLEPLTRSHGLSFADRACLALAHHRGLPAVTADKAWLEVDAGVQIQLIH